MSDSLPRPCGSWPSPLGATEVAGGSLRLSQVRLQGGRLYWLEGRPDEAGRGVVCVAGPGEVPRDVTPADQNVRSRVHEYGGGDYAASEHGLFFVAEAGGVHRQRAEGEGAVPVPGLARDARHADFAVSPDGRWLVAVEERAQAGAEPTNRLIAVPLEGDAPPVVFASSHDFVSSPCFSPDGERLAYLAWSHPHMPWDAAELRELRFGPAGPAGPSRHVAGGDGESVFQPGYSPEGRLTFVLDRSGWWNLHQEREGSVVCLHAREAEFGTPQWVFGMTTWAFVDENTVVAILRERGHDRIVRLNLESGACVALELPGVAVSSLAADSREVAFISATAEVGASLKRMTWAEGRVETVRASADLEFDARSISAAEPVTFPTGEGEEAYAFHYAPRSAGFEIPKGERPPLLVKIHGGPTAAASPGLDLGVQFWTQRGFAVLDVDHRGSTGYGRAFRERLYGLWGVVDVEDCVAGADYAVGAGLADPRRLAIRGGSAGGFTTLAALCFHDRFAAGCSRYGIGDLAALAADTHKFESRYTDRLVAPWPEGRDVYRERSPLHHVEGFDRPVLFFQGLDDRVVPPNQTETLVAALARRGVPHAYVAFAGEGHGFRRAETLIECLDAELHFYGRVFGFDGGPVPAGFELQHAEALPASAEGTRHAEGL
ncbi:MAG: S9 family peptidase [Deltaproteobacteria bacterium]|nr:S9 family peptidase [Deltaproteobacteria bacterium]